MRFLGLQRNWVIMVAVLLLGMLGFVSVKAKGEMESGAIITVDTLSDNFFVDGLCSLREAVQASNTDSPVDGCPAGFGADTIILPAGTYILEIEGRDEDGNVSGDLDILEDLTIRGAGTDLTVIDGNLIDRVIHIKDNANVEIRRVAIQNGLVINSLNGGGGILNKNSSLTLNQCILRDNQAEFVGDEAGLGGGLTNTGTTTVVDSTITGNIAEEGGGIFNGNTGTLFVRYTTVEGNFASATGGGIDNALIATLTNVIVSGNSAGAGGQGGGVFNDFKLTVDDSTITGNTADAGGGVFSNGELLFISASTISGNTASSSGGGVENHNQATLTNVTISGNDVGTEDAGGGVFNNRNLEIINSTLNANSDGMRNDVDGTVLFKNSMVVNSTEGENCSGVGVYHYGGHNLDSGNTCGFDINGEDPMLYSLSDNGGPTWTHALQPDSPAIDAGGSEGCPYYDQRGAYRPADGNGDGEKACDIGAFEHEAVFPIPLYIPLVVR